MSFSLQAIVGSTTYNLSDGAPFSLEDAAGLAMPSVVRYEQTSPLQHGATDLGYNLQPRVMTLALSFVAATDAILDGYRDNLNGIFKPSNGQAVQLRYTRDDDEVRQIDVHATDAAIEIERTHRPGHLHKAVIQLRAADPIWYAPTPGTVTFGTANHDDWWLAGGAIGSWLVREYATSPGTAQEWDFLYTTIPAWTVAIYGEMPGGDVNDNVAWWGGQPSLGQEFAAPWLRAGTTSTGDYQIATPRILVTTGDLTGGTHSVIVTETAGGGAGYRQRVFLDGQYIGGIVSPHPLEINGTAGVWRGYRDSNNVLHSAYSAAIGNAAVYYTDFNDGLVLALAYSMAGSVADSEYQGTVVYGGDYYDYPVLTLTGPLADIVLENLSTGDRLDFTGATIPAGATYTIDLRADALSVVDSGGTVRTNLLTDDSDLGTWALAPSPLVIGGTNIVRVSSTTSSTASLVTLTYRNRYTSY